MALLRGKLFNGLLFSGLLLGGQGEQVPVTPSVPLAGGGISRDIQYAKAPAKHVKLHINTWQEQETYGFISQKYELAAQHRVLVLANTGQEQESVVSITTQHASLVTKPVSLPDELVSVHYQLNLATAQVQEISGAITTRNISSPILADNSIPVVNDYLTTASDVTEISFGNILNTYQTQYVSGRITSSAPVHVSTYSLPNVVTAQIQESSIKISKQAIPHVAIKTIATYQQQEASVRITMDDDEMLQVLIAILELDSDIA